MDLRREKSKKPLKKGKVRGLRSGKTAPGGKESAGEWFEKLVALQERLRAPDGCPWDREQTHTSLRTYLIEEAYEVLDALKSGDDGKFAEEMGDLLLQIVFHSQIATEEGRFGVADVIREVHEKMVRRHPHVFGEKRAKDAAEVLRNWEQIKAQERAAKGPTAVKKEKRKSLLDGVTAALPATHEGLQLTRKAARAGFDWEDAQGVFEKLREECAELREAVKTGDAEKVEEETGDVLFAAVNLARFLKVDPEIALKGANGKFTRRFHAMEELAESDGRGFVTLPREEKERLWEKAKSAERELSGDEAGRGR